MVNTKKQFTTRQVRASMLGQTLLKAFGTKLGKKHIKSFTSACNMEGFPILNTSGLGSCIVWSKTPQGVSFWGNLNRTLYNKQGK